MKVMDYLTQPLISKTIIPSKVVKVKYYLNTLELFGTAIRTILKNIAQGYSLDIADLVH